MGQIPRMTQAEKNKISELTRVEKVEKITYEWAIVE